MRDGAPGRPAVYTIPGHRSFADALAAGLIHRFGKDPMGLATGRILLPNNRAVRTVTEAFVRASGGGLLLPRLIAVGDPNLGERASNAIETTAAGESTAPAIEPLERMLTLATVLRAGSSAEGMRLSTDLARALDALLVEEVPPERLADSIAGTGDLSRHWQKSLEQLRVIFEHWPAILEEQGRLDVTARRGRLLRGLAEQWAKQPPTGFTVAAGITTAAPAIAGLLARIARMPGGMVILPGLSLETVMPGAEWEALGPDEQGRGEQTHPQFHLKLLLDRMGIGRSEVQLWRHAGRAASSPSRSRAVANAMAAPDFSHKWQNLPAPERRLSGVRLAELPDSAAEAQAIALALREVLETPGKTAALVTPDRTLAKRVSALLARWDITADDSAGIPLSQEPAGSLLLALASAAAEDLAPVPLLALLKHPLIGGEEQARLDWLDDARVLDRKLRGPRPAAGLQGLDAYFADKGGEESWRRIRPAIAGVPDMLPDGGLSLPDFAAKLGEAAQVLAGERCWRGPAGRMAAQLLADIQASPAAVRLQVRADDAVALLRHLLDTQSVRPPYGGHPRIFIWGLLEARLQQADRVVLGGLNEGTWPAVPTPDPWLPPKVRSTIGLPSLEHRIGLAAHDFASALGAPEVLITRARRDGRSPTVASRFLLRLQAMTGGLVRDTRLERLALALDQAGPPTPAGRPEPKPPIDQRPRRISVTAVDRLKADPFAFYAQAILQLRRLEPVDAEVSAAWKGSAVHKVFEHWLSEDDCAADALRPRAEALLNDAAIHPMLRALWAPRLLEAIDWLAGVEREHQAAGRLPLAAELDGEATFGGITVFGRIDRVDRLPDGRLGIIDYKTGKPPSRKALSEGFALQLGLLGLIARAGGFRDVRGNPGTHEYWSLVKDRDRFGKLVQADKEIGAEAFLAEAERNLGALAAQYLTGDARFTAKLNPAYAPYGDYDQLMRLEEWYGRS